MPRPDEQRGRRPHRHQIRKKEISGNMYYRCIMCTYCIVIPVEQETKIVEADKMLREHHVLLK